MKKLLVLSFTVAALGCGDVNKPQPLPRDVPDAVERFLDSFRLAIEARDTSALRTMYVDDGRLQWIEDGEVRYRSPDDVFQGLATFPSDVVVHTEYGRIAIAPVGDAGARAAMQFQTTIGQGPSAFAFGGMISIILEDGPTGWRIVGGHTSSTRPDRR